METISINVYHKVANTDIYINWKSFAPNNWKWGTSKTLDYPIWVINKVFKEFQSKQNETTPIATGNEE